MTHREKLAITPHATFYPLTLEMVPKLGLYTRLQARASGEGATLKCTLLWTYLGEAYYSTHTTLSEAFVAPQLCTERIT